MKANSFPARITLLVQNLLDRLDSPAQSLPKVHPGKGPPKAIRVGRTKRRELYLYKKLIDLDTHTVVGHMADISSGGFKLDCSNAIPANRDFHFFMDLTSEVADKPHMTFVARSRWCCIDPLDPYLYNVGFQLLNIAPNDLDIFNRMREKYGRDVDGRVVALRRSNRW